MQNRDSKTNSKWFAILLKNTMHKVKFETNLDTASCVSSGVRLCVPVFMFFARDLVLTTPSQVSITKYLSNVCNIRQQHDLGLTSNISSI